MKTSKSILFCALMSLATTLWAAPTITGPNAACSNTYSNYTFEVYTITGSCLLVEWQVKGPNGAAIPFSFPNPPYDDQIQVLWPDGLNGVATITAKGEGCCVFYCEKTASITVQIGPKPITSLAGPLTICPGQSSTFSHASIPNALSYTWSVPSGWSIDGSSLFQSTTYNPWAAITPPTTATNGAYTIKVRANGCNGTSSSPFFSKTVYVGAFNNFQITGASCLAPTGGTYNFGITPSVSGSYQWTVTQPGRSNLYFTTASISFSTTSTSAVVTVKVNTGCGWSGEKAKLLSQCTPSISSVRTAGEPQPLELPLEKGDDDILLYPNSASSNLFIKLPNEKTVSNVKIFNSGGVLVREIVDNTPNGLLLNIENLLDGLYYLNITMNDKTILHKRLIVKH